MSGYFVCVAYFHIPKKQRGGEFSPTAKRKVPVGLWRDNSFKIFYPHSRRFLLCRDVKFDERCFDSKTGNRREDKAVEHFNLERIFDDLESGMEELDMDDTVAATGVSEGGEANEDPTPSPGAML